MLLAAILLLTTLPPLAEDSAVALRAQVVALRASGAEGAPYYQHVARAVSNWRAQAGAELRPVSLALVARVAPTEPAFVARCAKLNNYWCIKSARWTGEVGADAEGHTGFATAADGADAAAGLLRRYYRDYGRRTALAIVRRWAPASCGLPLLGPIARNAKPSPLAPRGIGGTLRARYLARHLPGGARRGGRTALRVQPWSPLARMSGHPARRPAIATRVASRPVTDIAAGLSDKPAAASAPVVRGADDPAALLDRKVPSPDRLVAESALLPMIVSGLSLGDLRAPAPLCGGDEVRIGNYAAAIAKSVRLRSTDDLALFSPDGSPLPNLAAVMRAMSAVELGALHAGPPLIEAAIARLGPVTAATADAAK
ncbi:hypothetical protein AFCDBAGC_1063 [Methylobacterium cerastii]|uniref:Transglycosylase SLT domain-containing protein n=1 Tax=Methylobacterium cerastii TaxID=932741 RepID=A0ABQ4QDC5_9HYPH|nr:hypothetical protein [Methylobacterium cerastii]GJD43214.1 hypothetical protein AFCDBAGC_1063 [Methylobacterium cerastii]